MNKENNSGIYKIESSINGMIYIGSSRDLRTRKNGHVSYLTRNVHSNKRLQDHVNNYGADDLKFEVIEFCGKDKLNIREQFYINEINPEFNIYMKAGSSVRTTNTIETKIWKLNAIIKESAKYTQLYKKAHCTLVKSKDFIIIKQELRSKGFTSFETKFPVSDIDNVIVRERAKLATYNKSEENDFTGHYCT